MALYQLTSSAASVTGQSVIREADGALIPNDLSNHDYNVYLAWLYLGNVPDALPAPPPPTVYQQYQTLLAGGIAVTSTASGSIDSVYNITGTFADGTDVTSTIDGVYAGIKGGDGLPSGQATFAYTDITGAPRNFGTAQFLAFANAVRNYRYLLSVQLVATAVSGTPTWPSSGYTIP